MKVKVILDLFYGKVNFGNIDFYMGKAVADLEGVQGVRSNPPSGPKSFHFHEEFQENMYEIRQTNPPFLHLNPLLRNPGSAPEKAKTMDILKTIAAF